MADTENGREEVMNGGPVKTAVRRATAAQRARKSNREERANRPKLLISILNPTDDAKMAEILNDYSVSLNFAFAGTGTARTTVLDYLGIGITEKSVMFSLIPESDEEAILH